MAYSFNFSDNESLSLQEFIGIVDEKFIPNNPKSLMDCAESLHKLSNNKNLLVDVIYEELCDTSKSFQGTNNYMPHSFSLYSCSNYYIRANIWKPIFENNNSKNWNEKIYKSLNTHDHNFYFLTVGYMGGGYETEIWEYDYDKVSCLSGEKVNMRFLEKTKLTKGKVMFYRASKDIHLQYPPEEYSISINVIPNNKKLFRNEQIFFNLESKTISRISNNTGSGRYFITALAQYFGDKKTIKTLEVLSQEHELPYIRMKSYDILSKISKEPQAIWEKALSDKSTIVTKKAALSLNELQKTNRP